MLRQGDNFETTIKGEQTLPTWNHRLTEDNSNHKMASSDGEEAIVSCGTTKGDIKLKLVRVSAFNVGYVYRSFWAKAMAMAMPSSFDNIRLMLYLIFFA